MKKGGRSASDPGRSRAGSEARYGGLDYSYSTPYGYSGCCVSSGVMVAVYRPGPRTYSGYYDSEASSTVNIIQLNFRIVLTPLVGVFMNLAMISPEMKFLMSISFLPIA